MITFLFQHRTAFGVVLLVSLVALGAALVAQFAFGLKPCILCLYERAPYALLVGVALFGLLTPTKTKSMTGIAALCFLLFLVSGALAFYHIGVEQHWWVFGSGCPVETLGNKTEEQALAELLTTPLAPCDKTGWSFLGFSITIWNLALSLGMAGYISVILISNRSKKTKTP